MNMSQAISAIKTELGLFDITLPFKDDDGRPIPTENVIYSVIQTMTIPIYSQFVPWHKIGDCNVADMFVVDQQKGIYKLPEFLCLTPILYVIDVRMPLHNTRGTYGDIAPAYGISRSAEGVVTSQSYMMLAGEMRAEPTFEYLGENKIRLYGWPKTLLTFEVACQHEPNGESIEPGCYDSFMELATLDIKVFLWNNLKRYKSIPSSYGNLNLEIDEFQGADQERKSLLDRWRDVYHLDMQWEKFM
jgi:hypothetical protein